MAFVYQPLRQGSESIRLLDLSASSTWKTGEIVGQLRHVSHSQLPSTHYETVSYLWGNPTPCEITIIDGRRLLVPKNADQALRRLSYPDRARTLWIDAVCINQADKGERAQQVLLMRQIYRTGNANLVFLVHADDDMVERFKHVAGSIRQEIEEDIQQSKSMNFNSLVLKEDWLWVRSSHGIRTELDVDALVAFFSNFLFE